MFNEQDIRPIPKYIMAKIKYAYFHTYDRYAKHTVFYSYISKIKKELALIVVAVRKKKGNELCMKQVVVHSVHSTKCFIKDIAFFNIAGYVVGWYEEGLSRYPKWYADGEWGYHDEKYFNVPASILNRDYIKKFKQYKYSCAELCNSYNLMKYLRIYEQHPQVEYLMKLGLDNFAFSKQIIQKLEKDKKFRKWIYQNSMELSHCRYITTALYAYKNNKSVDYSEKYISLTKSFIKNSSYNHINYLFNGNIKQFYDYIISNNINTYSYLDYLKACENLHLDMTKDRNKIPHNFAHWHNIRIDQYNSAKIKKDMEKRLEFYKQFANIAEKYTSLQRDKNENYAVIIAKSPADLIKEGEVLQHCVGRMNYDQKFVREETLIFFVRNINDINTPFVTLEYSLSNHKILQCYGYADSKPQDEVLEFVNKKWLPYANRKIRKIA